jgi:hypothetical protein
LKSAHLDLGGTPATGRRKISRGRTGRMNVAYRIRQTGRTTLPKYRSR